MKHFILLIIFLIFEPFSEAEKKPERIVAVKLSNLEKCKDRRYPLFKIENVTIDDNGKQDSTVSFNMTFLAGPYKNFEMPVEFLKCVYENEQCEHYITLKPKACQFLKIKQQLYSPYVEAFHPPMRCPLSGAYVIKNGWFSFDYVRKVFNFNVPQTILDSYWKVFIRLIDDKGPFGCYFINAKVKEFRRQSRYKRQK